MEPTDFSWALRQLKAGFALRRAGWNGPNQSVWAQHPDDHSKMSVPYLYLCNSQGNNVPWVPSQGDLFADDWEVLT